MWISLQFSSLILDVFCVYSQRKNRESKFSLSENHQNILSCLSRRTNRNKNPRRGFCSVAFQVNKLHVKLKIILNR